MPTRTASLLRLEHAELCGGCRDLLSTGTPVVTDEAGTVTCLACIDDAVPALRVVRHDPWSVVDDPELRTRLVRRAHAPRRAFALSA